MNFFRSEEHVRKWARFDPETEDGIVPLRDLIKLFSGRYFQRRLDRDYVSHSREYAREMVATLQEIGKTGPFWKRPKA
jgi:hypothetical protein